MSNAFLQETSGGLLPQLEDILAGRLPELLFLQPLQRWPHKQQSAFLYALKKIAIAVLRHHFRSAKHLGLLRGLLASLSDGAYPDWTMLCHFLPL